MDINCPPRVASKVTGGVLGVASKVTEEFFSMRKLTNKQEEAVVSYGFKSRRGVKVTGSRKERKEKLKPILADRRLWRRTPRKQRDKLFIKVMLRIMYPTLPNNIYPDKPLLGMLRPTSGM